MRKYYQYLGLALIMVFSFYYTEKIAAIVLSKNPLMQTIENEKDNYAVAYVNAYVDGDYIIPGINGLKVNTKESFYNMQKLDVFSEAYLVFEQVSPEISLEDNKDKIVRQGNSKLNQVSLVLETENEVSEYLKNAEYKASLLVTVDTYEAGNYFEVLNGETTAFTTLENKLNLNKENKHICILNSTNYELCLQNSNYLVEPTLNLHETNYLDIKKNLEKGSIIFISAQAKLSDVKLLLKEINYKGYEIVYLSELISEENI